MIAILTSPNHQIKRTLPAYAEVDWVLLTVVLALISIGILMVASASMDFANIEYQDPWFLVKKHGRHLLLAIVGGMIVFMIPSQFWQYYAWLWLLLTVVLLVLVLVPGIGKEVNGGRQWIDFGFISMQASEAAKFLLVIFFSSYLSRNHQQLKEDWKSAFKPIAMLMLVIALLLAETDLGGAIIIAVTIMAMIFVSGVRLIQVFVLAAIGFSTLSLVAVFNAERLERLKTFLDPWADQFDGGYQLTQSLIAFGQGEIYGVGLGRSIQKLSYLPDAHTDFVFSILAEEFGLIGSMVVVGLFVFLIYKVLKISMRAMVHNNGFTTLVAFGLAVLFAFQVFINIGVASGLIPTTGLTLPFISSGGSSLIVSVSFIALILRLDWELLTQPIKAVKQRLKRTKPTKQVSN